MKTFRGSRKHILDWTASDCFAAELTTMIQPTGAVVAAPGPWQPKGKTAPKEARLVTFGRQHLPGVIDWAALADWWLVHKRGNTPNWDLAAVCRLPAGPGLVLVEAKANDKEVKEEGKHLAADASEPSRENDERIKGAVRDARDHLERIVPGVRIDRAVEYQLSNRIAFAWKLSSMGLPTVLVFLGFLGDEGIRDAGQPFEDAAQWEQCFRMHARHVVPDSFFERPIDCGSARMWALIRSHPVLESSQPAASL